MRTTCAGASPDVFSALGLQFPLFTLMVMDLGLHGLPGAWVITSNEQYDTQVAFLQAFKDAVLRKCPLWRPSCILIDCCKHSIKAMRCALAGGAWRVQVPGRRLCHSLGQPATLLYRREAS